MTAIRSGPFDTRGAETEADEVPGRLVIDTSHSALSPHLRGRRVAVRVDGYPLRFAWGRTRVDLPAGHHLVEIEVEHGGGWGPVSEVVPVAAGHAVEVFYRAPALPHVAGSLGPSAQRTRGVPACVAMLAALALSVVVLLVAAVLGLAGLLG